MLVSCHPGYQLDAGSSALLQNILDQDTIYRLKDRCARDEHHIESDYLRQVFKKPDTMRVVGMPSAPQRNGRTRDDMRSFATAEPELFCDPRQI